MTKMDPDNIVPDNNDQKQEATPSNDLIKCPTQLTKMVPDNIVPDNHDQKQEATPPKDLIKCPKTNCTFETEQKESLNRHLKSKLFAKSFTTLLLFIGRL